MISKRFMVLNTNIKKKKNIVNRGGGLLLDPQFMMSKSMSDYDTKVLVIS